MSQVNNVKAMSANELLLDYTKGIGATANISELQEQDGYTVKGFELSQGQLVAFTRLYAKDKKHDFIAAMSKGFLGVLHESQYADGAKKASDTLVTTKVNLTADEYLANTIKLSLASASTFETISDLLLTARHMTDKNTKADLLALVHDFAAAFVNDESQAVYDAKKTDEEASALKFEALTKAGVLTIRPLVDGRFAGDIGLADLSTAVAAITENGYTVIGALTPLPSGLYQVCFKDSIAE